MPASTGLDGMQVECVVINSALHLGTFRHGLSVFADNWGLLGEPFGYSEVGTISDMSPM